MDERETKLTEKDRLTTAQKVIAVNLKTGECIWKTDKVFPQHFYPLSIIDYCEAVRRAVKDGIEQMPILSVSSKDFPYCDYRCIDCLACISREWAIAGNIRNPVLEIEHYKGILAEIARYSRARGCEHVRFEICGEGNPDLYKHRVEMIRYAAEECGMEIVYVSTGSRLTDELIDCLVRYAGCIRISFPGINHKSYEHYSNQPNPKKSFSYEDAVSLLEKLTSRRKEVGREGKLLIGTRTCIRPLNDGSYEEYIKTIGALGVDAFQAVKVLTPDFKGHQEQAMSQEAIDELLDMEKSYQQWGLKSFQIPRDLGKIYNNRAIDEKSKLAPYCWSSKVSPPLYGDRMICCIEWSKITNPSYHYGVMNGTVGELDNLMNGPSAKYINEHCPKDCIECCALNDNQFIQELYDTLRQRKDLDDIEFRLL